MKEEKDLSVKLPFRIIHSSDVLSKVDFHDLESMTDELQDTFLKSQVFRTRTEAEISVLNDVKFPTPASKYWQSVREQNVMFHELVMLSYEYRKNLVEIRKLLRDLDEEKDPLEKELKEIEIEKLQFISKNQERVAKHRIREIKMWSEIKAREAGKMSEKELENVDNHQLISYTKRFVNQALIMKLDGSPSERNNLLGQLETGLRTCRKKGLLDEVLKSFPEKIQLQLKNQYGEKLLK